MRERRHRAHAHTGFSVSATMRSVCSTLPSRSRFCATRISIGPCVHELQIYHKVGLKATLTTGLRRGLALRICIDIRFPSNSLLPDSVSFDSKGWALNLTLGVAHEQVWRVLGRPR